MKHRSILIAVLLIFSNVSLQALAENPRIEDSDDNVVSDFYFVVDQAVPTLSLTCKIAASTTGEYTLAWHDKDDGLISSGDTFDTVDSITLSHDLPLSADATSYTCIATLAADDTETQATVSMHVIGAVTATDSLEVHYGGAATFSCVLDTSNAALTAAGVVTVAWEPSGLGEVTSDPVAGVVTSTVTIAAVNIASAQTYTCTFTVPNVGTASAVVSAGSVILTVPNLAITPTYVGRGESVDFLCVCQAETEAECQLQWHGADNVVITGTSTSAFTGNTLTSTYTRDISDSDTASALNLIYCKANDDDAFKAMIAVVGIVGDVTPTDSLEVHYGAAAIFSCVLDTGNSALTATGVVTVAWEPSDLGGGSADTPDPVAGVVTSTVTIAAVDLDSSQTYTCTFTVNDEVTVEGAVALDVPNLEITTDSDYVVKGDSVVFLCVCKAETAAECQLKWYDDGVEITDGTNPGTFEESASNTLTSTYTTTISTTDTAALDNIYCVEQDDPNFAVNITVGSILELTMEATKKYAGVGQDNAEVACSLSGVDTEPEITIKVKDNGADDSTLLEVAGGTQTGGEKTVSVDTSSAKEVVYSCYISSGLYEVTSTDTKDIEIIGFTADVSAEYIVAEGAEATLTVRVAKIDGSSPPEIMWDGDSTATALTTDDDGAWHVAKLFGVGTVASSTLTYTDASILAGSFTLDTGSTVVKELLINIEQPRLLESSTLTITCTIAAADANTYDIKFYKGSTELVSGTTDVTLNDAVMNGNNDAVSRTMTKANLAAVDAGDDYKCEIDGSFSAAGQVTVDVLTPEESASPVHTVEAGSGKLTCSIAAALESTYTITWWKDDTALTQTTKYSIGVDYDKTTSSVLTSVLTINALETADGGSDYKCKVDSVSKDLPQVLVDVMSITNEMQYINEDTGTTLTCVVVSTAAYVSVEDLDVKWWLKGDGGETPDQDAGGVQTLAASNGLADSSIVNTLTLAGSAATGVYECRVDVVVKMDTTVHLISVVQPSGNTYYSDGEPLTLSCVYEAVPAASDAAPTYSWKDNNGDAIDGETSAEYIVTTPAAGAYTCVVTISTLATEGTTTLEARALALDLAGDRYMYATSAGEVKCLLSGLATETVTATWYKGDAEISGSSNTMTFDEVSNKLCDTYSFSAADETASGVYKCMAKGLESATMTLHVKKLTESPSGAQFWNSGDSLELTYTVEKILDLVPTYAYTGQNAANMDCATDTCTETVTVAWEEAASINVTISVTEDSLTNLLESPTTVEHSTPVYTRTLAGESSAVVVTSGSSLVLSCTVVAEEAPDSGALEIKWQYEGADLEEQSIVDVGAYDNVAYSLTSVLTVPEAEITKDMAAYSCQVPALTQLATHTFGTILVVDKPVLSADDEGYDEGSAVTLTCTRTANAAIVTELHHNGEVVADWTKSSEDSSTEQVVFTNSRIHYSGAGQYKCVANYTVDAVDHPVESETIEITINEYDESDEYINPDMENRIEVNFDDTIDVGSVVWTNERTLDTYTVVNDNKREVDITVERAGSKTTLVIPAGELSESTAFLVTAALNSEPHYKREFVKTYSTTVYNVLFDAEALHPDKAVMVIDITDYSGIPSVSTASTDDANVDVMNKGAQGGITVSVWPVSIEVGRQSDIQINTTVMFDNGQKFTEQLYLRQSDIETTPVKDVEGNWIVTYDSGMDAEEQENEALSCTFETGADGASIVGTAITGPKNFDNLGTSKTISLKFSDLDEPAEDAVDSYKCVFIVEFSGVTHEYSRTFDVSRKSGGGTNSGAIAAAVVIAILIIAIIVAFFVYRSRKNRSSSNQGNSGGVVHMNRLAEERA